VNDRFDPKGKGIVPISGASSKNVFKSLAKSLLSSAIDGDILKYIRGQWVAGKDKVPIEMGTRMIFNMATAQYGYVRWSGSKKTDERMVCIADGEPHPNRNDLGDLDEDLYELDSNGKRRDPWQFTLRVTMADPATGKLYSYSATSMGGREAFARFMGYYGEHADDHPNEHPLVELGSDSYEHSNRSFGTVYKPQLTLVGWVRKDANTIGAPAAAKSLQQHDLSEPPPNDPDDPGPDFPDDNDDRPPF
jgi:hypothetical protein